MQKRGAPAIVSRGASMKKKNAALFASIEQRYGVPAGPLITIWGMETGFRQLPRQGTHAVGRGNAGL